MRATLSGLCLTNFFNIGVAMFFIQIHRFLYLNIYSLTTGARTGGVDASIGFETFREENKGSAFNDSFTFWRPFVNEFVPMADLIALGTVVSMNLCGDPTTGVPEPGTGLEETLSQFHRAGFNQEDAIALTACGHTMGSVHHGGFPEVSLVSAVPIHNTNGGVNFDTSRGAFDPRVVYEYIEGIGQMGGPLVTSFNESSLSDLRLFESDGNKTMKELYDKVETFQDVCADVMGRMIDTVPYGVSLQDPIAPFPLQPINVTWDFNSDCQLVLCGRVRVFRGVLAPSDVVTIGLASQTLQLDAEEEEGLTVFSGIESNHTRVYGATRYYPFSMVVSGLTDVTSFQISAGGLNYTFPISQGSFFIPSATTSDGQHVVFEVAVPESQIEALSADLAVRIAVPVPQPLALAPLLIEGVGTWTSKSGIRGQYRSWTGTYDIGHQATGAISLNPLQGQSVLDTLLINAGVAGW
ncbi:putative Heme peroxidase [Seiridium unicorne]|uniref:Peroxidase n=1 Tax=Seiridium unicorne TaxID=138068 RepID=A0ABR2UY20_9PEZI